MYTGTKTFIFGDMSCGLMTLKLNCLAIMSNRCTSQNGIRIKKHYDENIEATSQDISQEFKVWVQMGLLNDNDPKNTANLVTKCLKDNKGNVLEWSSQSPDLSPIENSPIPVLSGGMGKNSSKQFWEAC